MNIKIAVIQFPGSNCDLDTIHVLNNVIGVEANLIWHNEFKGSQFDGCILPGGFSFGDYLRAGIIAAHSPAMDEVRIMHEEGKPIIGICNGFQILIESEFLPGALLRNESLKFICRWIKIKVENNKTAFTTRMKQGEILDMPIAHAEGRYFSDNLKELEENDQIVLKYSNEKGEITKEANPNGAQENIAGICNLERNCLGLMPHPERASEAILSPYRTTHGTLFFESMVDFIKKSNYDFWSDRPMREDGLYKDLEKALPTSKFILTVRETQSWISSYQHYFEKSPWEVKGPQDIERRIKEYEKKNNEIIEHFKDKSSQFLIVDIIKGDGWKELCNFLDKPIPDKPFPHKNKGKYKRI